MPERLHICKICSTFAADKDFKKKTYDLFASFIGTRGCGSFTIVFILTLLGWVPGVIAALIILNKNENQ